MPQSQNAVLLLPPRIGFQPLGPEDFRAAALRLGCDPLAIQAVIEVEAPMGAFDSRNVPTLLFERHLFHRYTAGEFDKVAPDLCNQLQGGYGTYGSQLSRLTRAYLLCPDAALRATSWGAFQILGDNFEPAGYGTAHEFCDAMCRSEQDQMHAFVNFINADVELQAALVAHNWAGFAAVYNGPQYARYHYDTNLAKAYAKLQKMKQPV